MTALMWVAASLVMYFAPGYLGGRYIYKKRRDYMKSRYELGPVGAGFWLMMCGPFGGIAGLATWIIDSGNRGSYGIWDKFFHYKERK